MIKICDVIDFIKSHGETEEPHTLFMPEMCDMCVEHNNKLYNILHAIIACYISGEETPQFWGIELDQNGEDTTNGMFFSFEDLGEKNRGIFMHYLHKTLAIEKNGDDWND